MAKARTASTSAGAERLEAATTLRAEYFTTTLCKKTHADDAPFSLPLY